jgi:imidazolonepropionase-like amidohydrolase
MRYQRTNATPTRGYGKGASGQSGALRLFRRAVETGVKIGYCIETSVYPHGMNAKDSAIMVSLGMTPIAALKGAASVNAELLSIAQKVGTVE